MPLLNAAVLLRRNFPEHLTQVPSELAVQRLPAALRDKDCVIFCTPISCGLGFLARPSMSFFRVLGGARSEASSVDPLKCQTATASPAEPGGLSLTLEPIACCGLRDRKVRRRTYERADHWGLRWVIEFA